MVRPTWKPAVACAFAKCALAKLPEGARPSQYPAEPMRLLGSSLKEVVIRRLMGGEAENRELFRDLQVSLEREDLAGAAEQAVSQALQATSLRLSPARTIPAQGHAAIELEQLYGALRHTSAVASEFADEVHNRYVVGWVAEIGGKPQAPAPGLRLVVH